MSALPLSVLALVMAVGVGALAPTTRILSAQHPAAASLLGRQVPGARFARGPVACAAPPAATRKVVVTDMDETLISKKSTGYVITFLLKSRSFRILLVPFLAAVRISALPRRQAFPNARKVHSPPDPCPLGLRRC
jgi:hypothetical protein